ncbi:MAG TPA: hypothetical protein PKY70_14590, partial [Nakamurella multipartita]|nr:hypothetical protein [Nakamurella multipartita]
YERTETVVIEGFVSGTTDEEAGDDIDALEGEVRDLLLSESAWLPKNDDGSMVLVGDEIGSEFGALGNGDRVLSFALLLPLKYAVQYVPADEPGTARYIDIDKKPPAGAGHETRETIDLGVPPG